ncbi:MAG TPA: putative glycoside hydrolase [Clostridiaceae bacterium]|nr:putative glycoside hydrolase [Clostridiaceae bacterium]
MFSACTKLNLSADQNGVVSTNIDVIDVNVTDDEAGNTNSTGSTGIAADNGNSNENSQDNNSADKSGGNVNNDSGGNEPEENSAGDDKVDVKDRKKIEVKALYLTGWTVGHPEKLEHYINLANSTEINSYVVDIKDDDGYVGYESNVPAVREIGAWKKKYDVDKVLKAFHDNNIHVIGRIVCFKDPVLSGKKPELAVKHVNGGLWKEKNSNGEMISWLNPYEKDSWPYLIEIAREAVEKGFDEIQFDYVRFPSGDKKVMDFGQNRPEKYKTINEFLRYARNELPGVVLSADIFGIVCESPGDTEDIGQYLETIGLDIDYISPMLYPSHYALGQVVNGIKFPKPDLEPYAVVYNSLVKAKNRISQVQGYKADVRPYIQDFTASWIGEGNYQVYTAKQVREQIQAVYDAEYKEWILWDARNKYEEDALLKE